MPRKAKPKPEPSPGDVALLQKRLGYRFRNEQRLHLALMHRSWAAAKAAESEAAPAMADNERLEFLGDAVLGLRVSERLMAAYPQASEGILSRFRSWIVSARHLARIAGELQLGHFILISRGEENVGGRGKERLLANVLEAVIGAIHEDGSYRAAARFVDRILGDLLEQSAPEHLHEFAYKSALQEWSHANGKPLPRYQMVGATGPEHGKTFIIEVRIEGVYSGRAQGQSKKEGEQRAARGALEFLGLVPPPAENAENTPTP